MEFSIVAKQIKRLKQRRHARGNLYILYVVLAGFLITAFCTASTLGLNSIFQMKVNNALEAASLQAASDLSKIVINDPHWGYISLTDHPPIGSSTIALDNEPLPVTGINTILATARQELIIAHAIGSTEALGCALEDLAAARMAQRRLQYALRESLSQEVSTYKDMNGKIVNPLKNAKEIFNMNTQQLASTCGYKLDSIKADLGYLKSGSTTNCLVPGLLSTAKVDKSLVANKKYIAFKDIPFAGESFYFAGLGEQASLVDSKDFAYSNGVQMCSIVKLTARLSKGSAKTRMIARACAQPFYEQDRTKPPIMALNFPHGLPSKLKSFRDLLTSEALTNKVSLLSAEGGDYPIDPGARLKPAKGIKNSTVRYAITRGYMDWIRAAHGKPNLNSLISNLDTRFNSGTKRSISKVHLYGIDKTGRIQILKPKKVPFRKQTTYNKQLYTVAFSAINSDNLAWTFKVRDQVRNLGTIKGGKHAGQPMPSIEYIDELNAIVKSGNEKERFSGKAGSRYDQSRLALEFEISSPQQISLSEASMY